MKKVCFLFSLIAGMMVKPPAVLPASASVPMSGEQADTLVAVSAPAADSIAPSDRNKSLNLESLYLYGDRTIEEALGRFTSVHRLPGTGFVIRGLSPVTGGLYRVTVNGQKLASTGLESRRVDLDRLPVDIFRSISLNQSEGADRPADAIAGFVHLDLLAPGKEQDRLEIFYARGVHTGYTDFLKPDNRLTLSVSDSYGDNLTFSAGLFFTNMSSGAERLDIEHGSFDFNGSRQDVTAALSPQFRTAYDLNKGGYFNVIIRATEQTDFFVSGFASVSDRDGNRHTHSYLPSGDWESPSETGLVGSRGIFEYLLELNESVLTQTMLTAGGSYRNDHWLVNYQGGWSFGGRMEEAVNIPFQATGLNYQSDRENPARPKLSISNREITNEDLRIQPMQNVAVRQNDHLLSARADVSYFIPQGIIRAGISFENSSKKGSYRDSGLRLLALSSVANFRHRNIDSFRLLQNDAYTFHMFVSPTDARNFFQNNYSLFRKDFRNQILNSDPRTYQAMEQVYAGYLKTNLSFGYFQLTAGARLEYTAGDYTGNDVLFNEIGNHAGTTDTTASSRYVHVLPNVLLGYDVSSEIRLIASWSQSLARQDYHYLTPYSLVHLQNQTKQTGNAVLKPVHSNNFDFKIRYANATGSRIQFGVFHKNMTGLVQSVEQAVAFSDGITLNETNFVRSDESVSVSGLEATIRQYFVFFPGYARNLGIAGGYAYTISDFSPEYRDGSHSFPGMSPHLVHAALFYASSRLSAQLSYTYVAPYTSMLAKERQQLPSLRNEVYADRKQSGYSSLNATVRFGLAAGVDIWAQALGLLAMERTEYTGSENLYPWLVEEANASLFQAGLRIRL